MPNAKRATYKMLFRSQSIITTVSTNTRIITITDESRWVQWRDERATVGRLARSATPAVEPPYSPRVLVRQRCYSGLKVLAKIEATKRSPG